MATFVTTPFLFFFFMLNSIPIPSFSCPLHQKQALLNFKSNIIALFNASPSDFYYPIQSWSPDSDCCSWNRVRCSKTRTVTQLYLSDIRPWYDSNTTMFFDIFTPLFHIRSLKQLEIAYNNLVGEIPRDGFGNLTELVYLDMRENEFNGSIPHQIFGLTKLGYLDMSFNRFEGNIGSQLGGSFWNLTSLRVLALSNNKLNGVLGVEVGKLRYLEKLDLRKNSLNGIIPEEIGNLTKLRQFYLANNKFSGGIPSSITNMKDLEVVDFSRNKFSKQIPISMSDLHNLKLLDLSRNKFSGNDIPVPSNNPDLFYVDLSYNEFSGKISTTFSTNTQVLHLGGNKFSGNLPWNFTKLVNLRSLVLDDNDFTGYLQDVLPQSPFLQVLVLRNNSFEGSIETAISNFTNLQIIDLSSNKLTGSIPREIANLKIMTETPVHMSTSTSGHFSFKASYVDWKFKQIEIAIEDLIVNWKNYFHGLSSRSLGIYSSLDFSVLDLSNNRISGEIPESLGYLRSLIVLNISNNVISGHIPVSFGNLKSIESLDLSHNKISGLIPQSIAKLDELVILYVSNNKLTGKIPVGGQMDTMNELEFFANNSGLCGIQIMIKCPEDMPPSQGRGEDDKKLSWIFWEGTWIGFPIGFFLSILIMGYTLNFLQLFKFW